MRKGFFILFIYGIAVSGCKKDISAPITPPVVAPPKVLPVIQTYGPGGGTYNSVVTITGLNFGTNSKNVSASINGKLAVILSVSDTSLLILVPLAAGTGDLIVNVNGVRFDLSTFIYSPSWMITTIAGNGTAGYADGDTAHSELNGPYTIAVDMNGNIYTFDQSQRIRKITPEGITSTVAGNGSIGNKDTICMLSSFGSHVALTVDGNGNIYAADLNNESIRKIVPGGLVTTVAGQHTAGHADSTGLKARFGGPWDIKWGPDGNFYILEYAYVRKMTPDYQVSTLAGDGNQGYVDGPGNIAEFWDPEYMAIDSKGNIYLTENWWERTRKITPDGTVSTLLTGQGNSSPEGLALDSAGNMYICDQSNNSISQILSGGGFGWSAGNWNTRGFKDGPMANALFDNPQAIAIDKNGNIYVADWGNNRIRKIWFQ
jgi:serine/threonine protein kinase, bacterial